MNAPTAHSGAFSTAEFVAARTFGNTKVPFEGGEGGRSVAQSEVIVREPWKTGMIPRRIVSEAFLDAREYSGHPPKPGRLKTHPRARRRTA